MRQCEVQRQQLTLRPKEGGMQPGGGVVSAYTTLLVRAYS